MVAPAKGGPAPTSFLKSSHFRITLWYTLLIGVLAVAFGAFIYLNQVREVFGESRFRVTKELDDLTHALAHGQAITVRDDEAYALLDPEGGLVRLQGLGEARALALARAADARPIQASREQEGGRPTKGLAWVKFLVDGSTLYGYVKLAGPEDKEGKGFLLFGTPMDPYGLKGRLFLNLLVAILLMLAAALLSGAWLARRAMRPVSLIAKTAKAIGEGDLSQRINLGTQDELGEIAGVFDVMLDRLEAAFERQRRFVADAGHELRTPLSIVMLESERALTTERKASEYRASLEVVRTEGSYMARLVEDLLALTRADEGGSRLRRDRVDLADLVVEALERLSPLAAARGVGLSARDLPEALVLGDRTALATLVCNLVDNGIKYGPAQGGRVALGLEAGAGQAVLRVEDNGRGIAPDKLGLVFDRFYRVDEARTEEGGRPAGSGLGLAIAKAVAEAHGGRIGVESVLGQGSVFTLSLPLAPRD